MLVNWETNLFCLRSRSSFTLTHTHTLRHSANKCSFVIWFGLIQLKNSKSYFAGRRITGLPYATLQCTSVNWTEFVCFFFCFLLSVFLSLFTVDPESEWSSLVHISRYLLTVICVVKSVLLCYSHLPPSVKKKKHTVWTQKSVFLFS